VPQSGTSRLSLQSGRTLPAVRPDCVVRAGPSPRVRPYRMRRPGYVLLTAHPSIAYGGLERIQTVRLAPTGRRRRC
jgi:hypothetical protein